MFDNKYFIILVLNFNTLGCLQLNSYILFINIIGGILVLFIYTTRQASKEIFSPSNKIHREVGRAKDLSAPLYIDNAMELGSVRWNTIVNERAVLISLMMQRFRMQVTKVIDYLFPLQISSHVTQICLS